MNYILPFAFLLNEDPYIIGIFTVFNLKSHPACLQMEQKIKFLSAQY